MNQDLSLTLNNVNPNSWIIMAFQNLCMNSGDCTELDYNTGTMVIEVDIMGFNWICELLDYTEESDTTRDQLLEFYNKLRTEIPELEGYPEYN